VRPSEKSIRQMRKMTFDKVEESPEKKSKHETPLPTLSILQGYVGKKAFLDDGTEVIVNKLIVEEDSVYFEGQDLKSLQYLMFFRKR
jgi:hypothetical protein